MNGWDVQSKRIFGEDGIAPTLNSGCREGGGIQPSVLQSAGFCGYASHTAKSIGYEEETAPTLKGNDWQCQVPDVLQATAIRVAQTSANGCGIAEELAHTVDCTQPEAVAFAQSQFGDEIAGTLTRRADSSPCADRGQNVVAFAHSNRNEVRLQSGDGSITGPVAASDSAKGQGVPFVMASGQANAEISDDGTSPTITCLHEQPIICMADDTQNAAVDEDMSGTLKVGGGSPIVAMQGGSDG